MATELLYQNEAEKRQHLSAIHILSIELGVSEDYIKQIYENELKKLKENARITDFLSVLVMKRIKEKIETNLNPKNKIVLKMPQKGEPADKGL